MAGSGIFERAMSHLHINTDVKERQYQFRDRCSRTVQLDETVTLPFEATAVFLPELIMTSGPGASFKGGFTVEGNKLIMGQQLKFKKRIYDPEDWGSFQAAVENQKRVIENPVILKKSNL